MTPFEDREGLARALRASGQPLGASDDFLCLLALDGPLPRAVVVTPSGLAYRMEPAELDPVIWSFAARNYFVVTGNLADRQRLAELANLPDVKEIGGSALSRKKGSSVSGISLDQLLAAYGYPGAAHVMTQTEMF